MYARDLVNKINLLSNSFPSETIKNCSFHEQIILAYRQWVIRKLNHILKRFDTSQAKLDKALAYELKGFLNENWTLINGTCLSFTVLQNDLSLLLFSIAKDIVDFKQEVEGHSCCLIELLMPSVCIESLVPTKFSHLTTNSIEELTSLLKSLILGTDGLYCIPGSLLLTLNEHAPDSPIRNYYFDYEKHSDVHAYLNHFDIKKLIHQSPEAEAYYNAVVDSNNLLKEEDSLYSRLEILWKHLYYNSKSIVGKEEISGEGIYSNLLNFMNYYDDLEKNKENIPDKVKAEINLLKSVSSIQSGLTACLSMRQESLWQVIREHEHELRAIPKEKNNKELSNFKLQLNEARKNFTEALTRSGLVCKDNLGLTHDLVKRLNITIDLSTAKSFFDFITLLTPEEIHSFCQDDSIKQIILSSIKNIEELIILMTTGLSDLQLESFIQNIQEILIHPNNPHSLLKKPEDLIAVLLFLTNKPMQIFLDIIQSKLPQIVKSASSLLRFLKPFQGTQFRQICRSLYPHLSQLIQSKEDLRTLLENLNSNQSAIIYELWGSYFPKVIKKGTDFSFIACILNKNEQIKLYESLETQLPSIIRSGKDFCATLFYLTDTQRSTIYHTLKKHVLHLIQSSTDFNYVLAPLNEGDRFTIYESIQNKLPQLIQSAQDFNNICEYLKKSQRAELFDIYKEHFSKIIQTIDDFKNIFLYLNKPQRASLYELCKTNLPNIILSGRDFNSVLDYLNKPQKEEVYHSFKTTLPHFMQSSEDSYWVLEGLNKTQRKEMFDSLPTNLSQLIQEPQDFRILNLFEETECIKICKTLKPQLSQIIDNEYDCQKVLCSLNALPSLVVCRFFKDHLAKIISSVEKFNIVIRYLNHSQRSIIYDALKEHLMDLISSEKDLAQITYLHKSEQKELLESYKKHKNNFTFFGNEPSNEPLQTNLPSYRNKKNISHVKSF